MSSRAALCFVPLLILWLFWPTLVGRQRLAFRDVSHFYTPLYEYVAERTNNQWLPLWNPLAQTGVPLLGETTTAVLYPVRYLVYALPLAAETAMAWYVTVHLILAFLSATAAARWAGAAKGTAPLGGLIYALSGSVLFLYTNPPFLVGAAWLPLVVGPLLSASNSNRRRTSGCRFARLPGHLRVQLQRDAYFGSGQRVLIAAPAMAMMILGGDPQSALHAMLTVSLFYLSKFVFRVRTDVTWKTVATVPLVAAALTAPQLAASISWSGQSDRVARSYGRQTVEPAPVLSSGERSYGRDDAFRFSLPPWHAAELITPNAFGSLFPIHQRLSRLIPGDGQMWTPSIYLSTFGLLALVSSALAIRICGMDRWLTIAVISLWLSMGHFGLLWVIQFTTGWLTQFHSAIGGPYWLLYNFLPGYDAFRYPAKWLPVFSLAVAIIAARFADRWDGEASRRLPVWPIVATVLLALTAVTAARMNPSWWTDLKRPVDEFWGPLDIAGGLQQIQFSLIHSTVVLLAILALLTSRRFSSVRPALLLLLIGVELAIAGTAMIATVPRETEQQLIAALAPRELYAGTRLMRTRTGSGWPASWRETADAERLLDVEASQRGSMFGRWHLESGSAMLNSMASIQSRAMATFWAETATTTRTLSANERKRFWQDTQDWLGVGGTVHTSSDTTHEPINGRTAQLVSVQFLRSYARQSVDQVPPTTGQRSHVATHTPLTQSNRHRGVVVDSAGLLTRPVFQDGHWTAEYSPAGAGRWRPVTVQQVAGIAQGVPLPAGTWDLRFHYAPRWLLPTLSLAILAWLIWVVIVIRTWAWRKS